MKNYKKILALSLISLLSGCTNSNWTKVSLKEFGFRGVDIYSHMIKTCGEKSISYNLNIELKEGAKSTAKGNVVFDLKNSQIYLSLTKTNDATPGETVVESALIYYDQEKGIVLNRMFKEDSYVLNKFTTVLIDLDSLSNYARVEPSLNDIAQCEVYEFENWFYACFSGDIMVTAAGNYGEREIATKLADNYPNAKLKESSFGYQKNDKGSAMFDITVTGAYGDDRNSMRIAAELKDYCCSTYTYEETLYGMTGDESSFYTYSVHAKKNKDSVKIEIPSLSFWGE